MSYVCDRYRARRSTTGRSCDGTGRRCDETVYARMVRVRDRARFANLSRMDLPDDNLHAPNEKFHIPNFYRGIEAIIRFFTIVGEDK